MIKNILMCYKTHETINGIEQVGTVVHYDPIMKNHKKVKWIIAKNLVENKILCTKEISSLGYVIFLEEIIA